MRGGGEEGIKGCADGESQVREAREKHGSLLKGDGAMDI